jgi:uncharacterized protein YbjT (DUF2867 family)
MKVLVTGGTGVVGQAAVTELLKDGHTVRLLSRNANEDARQWLEGVEPWPASICDQSELRGCAEGCDLVLHAAGVVEEASPQHDEEKLDEAKAERVEDWVKELVVERKSAQQAMSRAATRPAAEHEAIGTDAVL